MSLGENFCRYVMKIKRADQGYVLQLVSTTFAHVYTLDRYDHCIVVETRHTCMEMLLKATLDVLLGYSEVGILMRSAMRIWH